MRETFQPPEKLHWRGNWNERQVKQLLERAVTFLQQGAFDMRSAWYAAENELCDQNNPYFREAMKSGD